MILRTFLIKQQFLFVLVKMYKYFYLNYVCNFTMNVNSPHYPCILEVFLLWYSLFYYSNRAKKFKFFRNSQNLIFAGILIKLCQTFLSLAHPTDLFKANLTIHTHTT